MLENINQLKAFYGFNEDYFKVGQLIKITAKNYQGAFLEKFYGFIKKIDRERITLISVGKDGKIEERFIFPADLSQSRLDIKIEIIGE